jgi:hypothetical protein
MHYWSEVYHVLQCVVSRVNVCIQLHPGIVSHLYHSYLLVTCNHKTEYDDTLNISTKYNLV